MIHLAILNIGQSFAYEFMYGLLLLHGGYIQILTHIVDAINGTNYTGGASAEKFQQLKRIGKFKISFELIWHHCFLFVNLRVLD